MWPCHWLRCIPHGPAERTFPMSYSPWRNYTKQSRRNQEAHHPAKYLWCRYRAWCRWHRPSPLLALPDCWWRNAAGSAQPRLQDYAGQLVTWAIQGCWFVQYHRVEARQGRSLPNHYVWWHDRCITSWLAKETWRILQLHRPQTQSNPEARHYK